MNRNDPRIIRVKEVFENEKVRLSALFGVDLTRVTIVVKPYRGRKLGEAFIQRWTEKFAEIRINSNYFQHFDSYYKIVDSTITHELIHVAATLKFGWGVQSHGKEWKLMMRAAGKSPERTAKVTPHNEAKNAGLVVRCACGKEFRVGEWHWSRRNVLTHNSCGRFLKEATLLGKI